LIAIYKKAVVWFSIMMIPYCVFSSFLEEYPSLIFIIRIILATAFAIIAIGGMMSYLFSYIEIPRRPLKEKGIIRKGKLEFIEKNKESKKTLIVELGESEEEQLEKYIVEIEMLVQQKEVPPPINGKQCKKCAYYEYCYI